MGEWTAYLVIFALILIILLLDLIFEKCVFQYFGGYLLNFERFEEESVVVLQDQALLDFETGLVKLVLLEIIDRNLKYPCREARSE